MPECCLPLTEVWGFWRTCQGARKGQMKQNATVLSPRTARISRCRDEKFFLQNEFADFCCFFFSHWILFFLYARVFLFFLILLFNMWVESEHLTHTLLLHCPANRCTINFNYPCLALEALNNLVSFILYSSIRMLTYSCVFIKFIFIKHLLCPRYNDRE